MINESIIAIKEIGIIAKDHKIAIIPYKKIKKLKYQGISHLVHNYDYICDDIYLELDKEFIKNERYYIDEYFEFDNHSLGCNSEDTIYELVQNNDVLSIKIFYQNDNYRSLTIPWVNKEEKENNLQENKESKDTCVITWHNPNRKNEIRMWFYGNKSN